MPSYEICYLKADGTLAESFATQCDDPRQAKILAHAMKNEGFRRIEVWDGRTLVYRRPPEHPE